MSEPAPDPRPEIAFLFIGGAHQVFHLAPVAAELAALRPDHRVTCLHADPATGAALETVRRAWYASAMGIEAVAVPRSAHWLAHLLHHHSAAKGPLLFGLRRRLARAAAVVTPERTSAFLRLMGLRTPLVHFRHGAGDRAPRSERRLRAFDLIVVPGEKDAARAIRLGVAPSRIRTCGYVKLDLMAKLRGHAAPLFDNHRPTVVYNPHFDASISSWKVADAVMAAFKMQNRYNLVFAPHVRVAEDMDAATRARWQALAEPGRIIVDLGSPRLFDMSYTMGADVYLGDMSSQLYEFLARPRPAAFLNAHGVRWRDDPRHAGWHLGEVTDRVDDLIAAIDRAIEHQPARRAAQVAALAEAFGDWDGAAARGAAHVAALLPPAGAGGRPQNAALHRHDAHQH